MTTTNPLKVYEGLRDTYAIRHHALARSISMVSVVRILIFVAGIIGVYVSAGFTAMHVAIVAVVFVSLFVWIVIRHSKLHKEKDDVTRLLKINENEILALKGKYNAFGDGAEFLEDNHPFAADLDIFGKGSIFQYINRTSTVIGRKLLAGWFLSPAMNPDVIRERQESIAELREKLQWRQAFHTVGIWLQDSEEDKDGIIDWMKKPGEFSGKGFKILIWLMPFISTFVLGLLIRGLIDFQIFTLYMFIPLGIAFAQAKRIIRKHELLSKKAELLDKYGRLISMIENEDFSSKGLKSTKEQLTDTHRAGEALRRLSKIINAFDSRLNIFAWLILNYFALWDILQARRLEKWRKKYRSDAEVWFDILAHFDALNSLANFWHNRPDFILPEPVNKPFFIDATRCGHPLLKPETRIDNPVAFDGWKQFIIVTGANMAGKSTYLRTVAINFILAMTGAPVCAGTFRFSPAQIFTSIRTRDNLLESESYFFAELKRLKAIIDRLAEGQPLFIILDEILKGTNSKDKQEGSKALLKQLIRFESSGLIATHDLKLGELINEYPENIRNKRFEVEIEKNELVFDYLLKDGISRNLNATFLMKKMGITI